MTHTYSPDAPTETFAVNQSAGSVDVDAGDVDALGPDRELAVAVASFVSGLLVLAVVFANLSRIAGWADQYGAVWIYLGFFLALSIAGRVFWKGADTLIARLIRGGR